MVCPITYGDHNELAKLRELAVSYRSYGFELSFRARHATCVALTILSVSDCVRVGRLNRASCGLPEDADWLMLLACLLAACALANSDCCGGDQLLLRAGSFIMIGIITGLLHEVAHPSISYHT